MKLLILDDHPLVRDALSRVLKGLGSDLIVLEAADPKSAFQIIESAPDLDLVLLDLALPGMHGMTALQRLREKHPAISVVVISASAERDSVQRALDCGALGFIPKSSSNEVLKGALRLVLAGGIYVPPEMIGRGPAAALSSDESASGRATTLPTDIGLTERQAQILALMMKGESNKLIGRELGMAESTVKNQITVVLKALSVTSRTQAVLAAIKLGLRLPAIPADKSR
jgi:DNA-binding NarL/FixJ family response regulator